MPQNDSWTKPRGRLDQLTGGNRQNFAQFGCIRDIVVFVHTIIAVRGGRFETNSRHSAFVNRLCTTAA
jgi:hypothetical protein